MLTLALTLALTLTLTLTLTLWSSTPQCEPLAPATMTPTHLRAQFPWYFLYPALASSIVRAKQAQLGPLDGRGFETPRVQNTLLPNPSEGSAPSLRAAASESASCRRLGVTQAVASVPRAARP